MKFILLVEGFTEHKSLAEFLKRWLDQRLTRPVGIDAVRFNGFADLERKMSTRARMYLDGPNAGEIIGVIGLMDLYGPEFYPRAHTTAKDRRDWGIEHFEELVDRKSRFRMMFAVHEVEAWLLSEPRIFPQEVKESLPAKISEPEKVNFDEPPAKLLDRIYKSRLRKNYKKTTYGKQLFKKLDPGVAAGKCPCLKEMLESMLRMAIDAGL